MRTSFRIVLPVIALALVSGLGAADAQQLRNSRGPAEIPPASFTGTQYVDSKGCVFIRAGYGGNVQWVPRVSRARQVLCGQTPTNVAAATRPAANAPRPAPVTMPAPAQTVRSAPQQVFEPMPRTGGPAPMPAPAQGRVPAPSGGGAGCPGMSPHSAAYMNSSSRYPVRCGPQAIHPATGASGVSAAPPLETPPGYRRVFDDGRLNPLRGVQTLEGNMQMGLVWTQTVPRKLVNPVSGRDLRNLYPELQYPFTTLAEQRAAAASGQPTQVTLPNGNVVNVRMVRGRAVIASPVTAAAPAPRVSTKSVAAEESGASRYVQVASFPSDAQAEAAAAQVRAMGLPVRMGRGQNSGDRIVLTGPFADSGAGSALSRVKGAGFGQAFLR